MLLSSIFSFDTLQRPREVPKALLLALGLLLGVELLVARGSWFWHQIPRSSVGVVDALENEVIAPAPDPAVVLLGNSRLRDAIAPRLLEARLGLPQRSVLNLALTSGVPFDSLVVYRRNQSKLSRAKVLVVDFEPWYFKSDMELSGRVQRFASLEERIQIFRGTDQLVSSILGYYWRTYGAGTSLSGWRRNCFRPDRVAAIAPDGRVVWRDAELDIAAAQETLGRADAYRDPRLYFAHREQLLRLIHLARNDGVCVVLFQLPVRDFAADHARDRYPSAYAACLRELAKVASEVDASLCFESARHAGITDDDFLDYGHVNARGSKVMTEKLGDFLKAEFP